jgi:hypothetical protein
MRSELRQILPLHIIIIICLACKWLSNLFVVFKVVDTVFTFFICSTGRSFNAMQYGRCARVGGEGTVGH